MTIAASIKVVESDPHSLYTALDVRFSSDKRIDTPISAVDLKRLKNKFLINSRGRGLNEMFKRFTPESIKKCDENNVSYDELETEINTLKNRIGVNESTICFLEFDSGRLPTLDEIEFMTQTAYPHSQITPIPFVSYINNVDHHTEEVFAAFKQYLADTIESINQLNNKPIMGIIPKIAPKKMKELVQFYQNKGINCLAFDLNGSNPISSSGRIFRLLKTLKKENLLEKTYIHGYNVGIRVNKVADSVPAKNILGFGVGLNSIGDKHKKFIPNRAFLESIENHPENKFRLFNKEEYSYWRGLTLSQVADVYPADSRIDLDLFKTYSDKGFLQRLFNIEQISVEAAILREKIREAPEKSLDYLRAKNKVEADDLSLISTAKNKI